MKIIARQVRLSKIIQFGRVYLQKFAVRCWGHQVEFRCLVEGSKDWQRFPRL